MHRWVQLIFFRRHIGPTAQQICCRQAVNLQLNKRRREEMDMFCALAVEMPQRENGYVDRRRSLPVQVDPVLGLGCWRENIREEEIVLNITIGLLDAL